MRRLGLFAALAIALAPAAFAQDADTEKAIEKYRAMLKEDPWSNPGFLDADRGEALWTTKAGPKNASFEPETASSLTMNSHTIAIIRSAHPESPALARR